MNVIARIFSAKLKVVSNTRSLCNAGDVCVPLLGLFRRRRHGTAAGIQNQPVRLDPVPVESDSDVADDQQPPESESQSQLVKALKRRLQTAPARAAKALKKVETTAKGVPLESELETSDQSYALRLQRAFFTHNYQRGGYHKPALDPSNDPARHGDDIDGKQKFARERARCIWSLLLSMKGAICKLFDSGRGKVRHFLNCSIADDSSTRLKAAGAGGGRSVVHTIMNSFQSAHFRFESGEWDCLHVLTPLQVLGSGRAEAIHQGFTAWLLSSSSGLGCVWRRLGIPEDLLSRHCQWKTTLMMGDALKANDAAWRCERAKRVAADDPRSLGVRFRCCNHQLCLVRRPMVLSLENYWTTVVRLAHLFETHSFRRSLASALIAVLQRDGGFVRVQA